MTKAKDKAKAPAASAPTVPAKPAKAASAKTVPAVTLPAQTVPAETAPAETAPAETVPAETVPAETVPAETAPAETAPAAADADPAVPVVETDPRKRFRAALDRKNATPGTHPGSMASGNNDLKSSNGKRQRQFRRKSGG